MSSSLILRSTLPKALVKRSLIRSSTQIRQATSDRFAYVPGGPIYKGTVNDPTTFPPPSKTHGSYHWAFERLVSAALVPMTVAAFATIISDSILLLSTTYTLRRLLGLWLGCINSTRMILVLPNSLLKCGLHELKDPVRPSIRQERERACAIV
ncbi:mitochondrial inner membrane protein [Lentinula edodes]|uniref:Succinate dehydrogenase [ubiquinone] cytochrome b small subunit n=1 Tax=Lentinula edodes TaxID=5353 RepID=A0A1Q3ET00_LENED|nr:mitochondrial inner membrane protein [Lentinula edodes]